MCGHFPLNSAVRYYYYVIGTVVVKRSAPVAALKTFTVASSPTTGFRPGGHSAAAVVTSKLTRPARGVIGSLVSGVSSTKKGPEPEKAQPFPI